MGKIKDIRNGWAKPRLSKLEDFTFYVFDENSDNRESKGNKISGIQSLHISMGFDDLMDLYEKLYCSNPGYDYWVDTCADLTHEKSRLVLGIKEGIEYFLSKSSFYYAMSMGLSSVEGCERIWTDYSRTDRIFGMVMDELVRRKDVHFTEGVVEEREALIRAHNEFLNFMSSGRSPNLRESFYHNLSREVGFMGRNLELIRRNIKRDGTQKLREFVNLRDMYVALAQRFKERYSAETQFRKTSDVDDNIFSSAIASSYITGKPQILVTSDKGIRDLVKVVKTRDFPDEFRGLSRPYMRDDSCSVGVSGKYYSILIKSK